MHVTAHARNVVQRDAGARQQMQVDRQDDLLQDDEVVGEDESVDGGRHGPLEGVLDGHEPLIEGGVGHGPEQILERGVGDRVDVL